MGLTLWGRCCMVLEKPQHNAFHFLRKGNLCELWASPGIFREIRDFYPFKKIPGDIGQTKRNHWMENGSCALPFPPGVKKIAQEKVQNIKLLCVLIPAADRNKADVTTM